MFDHQAHRDGADDASYERWLGRLHASAMSIDVDLGRVLNRHGLADIDRGDPGTMFTITDEEAILALIRAALTNGAVVDAAPDRLELAYDAGYEVGLGARGEPLTGVRVVLDTDEMTGPADWDRAWVCSARPVDPAAPADPAFP